MTMNSLGEYGKPFQVKVLFSLLNDKKFLENVADIITEDYFDSAAHKWIVNYTLKYFQQYNANPTMEVLAVEVKKIKNNDVLKLAVKEELKQVYTGTVDDIDYIKEEFLSFARNQKVKEALLRSVDLMESGEFDSIRKTMEDALKAGEPKDIGLVLSKDIEIRYREEEEIRIPFPWDAFNSATDGGMPPGTLVVLMGGTGSGKSTMACHMGLHAAKNNFNVAYYTLELSDKYVGKKIDSILTGIEVKQLKHNRELIEELNGQIPGQIIVKEFYPGRSSMDQIEAHLRHLKQDMGITVDLIVIDYPELLRPRRVRKDILEESNDIYTDIKGYCKENGSRIIAPSQLNRSGMKADIAEHDSIAGNIGKIFIADLTITVSRKRADKLAKTARFHFLKSRLGEDGMTWNAHMDLKHNKIEVLDEYDPEEETVKVEETKARINQKFRKLSD